MKKTKSLIFAILSAGWLFPLYLAGSNFKSYLETELEPKIMRQPMTHSFPILAVCHFLFTIAIIWLALVIICWSLYYLRVSSGNRE
jgi:hypothetical protein